MSGSSIHSSESIHRICKDFMSLGEVNKEHISLKNGQPQVGKKTTSFCSKFYKPKHRRLQSVFDSTVHFLEQHKALLKDSQFLRENVQALRHMHGYFSAKNPAKLFRLGNIIAELSPNLDLNYTKKIEELVAQDKNEEKELHVKLNNNQTRTKNLAQEIEKDKAQIEQARQEANVNPPAPKPYQNTIHFESLIQTYLRKNPNRDVVIKFRNDKTFHVHSALLDNLRHQSNAPNITEKSIDLTHIDCNVPFEDLFYLSKPIQTYDEAIKLMQIYGALNLDIRVVECLKFILSFLKDNKPTSLVELYSIVQMIQDRRDAVSDLIKEAVQKKLFQIYGIRSVGNIVIDFNNMCDIAAQSNHAKKYEFPEKVLLEIPYSFYTPQAISNLRNTGHLQKFLENVNRFPQTPQIQNIVYYIQLNDQDPIECEKGFKGLENISTLCDDAAHSVGLWLLAGAVGVPQDINRDSQILRGSQILNELVKKNLKYTPSVLKYFLRYNVFNSFSIELFESYVNSVTQGQSFLDTEFLKNISNALAALYLEGKVVSKDLEKAYAFVQKAAKGHPFSFGGKFYADAFYDVVKRFPMEFIIQKADAGNNPDRVFLIYQYTSEKDLDLSLLTPRTIEWIKEFANTQNDASNIQAKVLLGIIYIGTEKCKEGVDYISAAYKSKEINDSLRNTLESTIHAQSNNSMIMKKNIIHALFSGEIGEFSKWSFKWMEEIAKSTQDFDLFRMANWILALQNYKWKFEYKEYFKNALSSNGNGSEDLTKLLKEKYKALQDKDKSLPSY